MDNPISLSLWEVTPMAIYLVGLLWLGFREKNHSASETEYILGGRKLTLPAFVATLVTTWYGGILGVGEFTWLYGISNWIVFGLPYYVFALLFAWLMAPRIQASSCQSIPDQFYRHYGKTGGLLGAVFMIFITLPAPYVLMIGLFLNMLTGWHLLFCITIGTLVSMLYVLNGGFRAVTRTDKLQFILMFSGFLILLVSLVWQFGGPDFLQENLPPLHLSWHGGNSSAYMLAWFFIALWTFIDPGFHQRCFAAESPKVARKGILLSVGFWLVFDFLTTMCGLYARALLSDVEPVLSFPLLGHTYLPALLSGLFLTALLATIMSTIDSLSLLSAVTIGYDILGKFSIKKFGSVSLMRVGLLMTTVLSILLAWSIPSVIQIWFVIGTLFVPALLLPLLACYFPGIMPADKRWMPAMMTVTFLTSSLFIGFSIAQSESLAFIEYLWGWQPIYPGLLVSAVMLLLALLFSGRGTASSDKAF